MTRTALYRHFDAAGALLYVGISLSAVQRLAQHKQTAAWFDGIARVEVQWLASREEALTAEAIAIAKEGPLWNVARPQVEGPVQRSAPIASATDEIKVRGEELHPVLWQGRQWAVTEYGIEARDGTYAISARRLHEDERRGWSWHQQMEEKEWVDLADFDTAFEIACWLLLGEPIARTRQLLEKLRSKQREA